MTKVDVLLVGQGLAGSLLAWELIQRRQTVLVIDPGEENASQVAAGLVNPVTGQRLVKQAGAEQLLAVARACYQQLADNLGETFFFDLPMLRLLRRPQEHVYAEKRLQQPDYRAFLGELSRGNDELAADAVLQQHQTGFVATHPLLQQLRAFFIANHALLERRFDYAALQFADGLWNWEAVAARQVVFCEGYQIGNNPWFKQLPMQAARGEILTCRSATKLPGQILNDGHWLIPLSDQQFKTGASFTPGRFDCLPSEAARLELLAAAKRLYPPLNTIEVQNQQVGIRPTTLDKQPLVGEHPHHPGLHIFNGFGSKGSLMIPWYAAQMAAALGGLPHCIPATSHIGRYYDTHFSR